MNFREAAEERFENCERDELVQFCDILGVEYLPQNNAKHLRDKLLAALGEYHEIVNPGSKDQQVFHEPPKELPKLDAKVLSGLNLRSQGYWQGRRRRITLHRVMEYESTIFPHFFAWEGLHCYVPFGQQVDIPYSIWNVLQDANRGERIVRKRRVDDDGRVFFVESRVPVQRFMITDHGDTPGTEHLPTDVQDQVRMMWQVTNEFDGYSATQFRAICRLLKITVLEEWKASDMKMAIKRLVGLQEGSSLSEPEGRTPKRAVA